MCLLHETVNSIINKPSLLSKELQESFRRMAEGPLSCQVTVGELAKINCTL
jgi:hypothetical protein